MVSDDLAQRIRDIAQTIVGADTQEGRDLIAAADALAEKDKEIERLRGGMVDTQLAWGRSASVKTAVRDLPQGVFQGANRYDTDNECVLSLWVDGKTYDVRWPKGGGR